MRTHVSTRSHAFSDPRSPPASACPSAPERRRASRRSAAPTSSDLRWPGGVECPRCSEHVRLLWLDVPLEVALLLVPLPVQRHRRHALPQLAPARLEVVRRRPPDARVARGPLGERAAADRSAGATRPPGSRRTGSAPRCAATAPSCCAASSTPSCAAGAATPPTTRRPRPRPQHRCSPGCAGVVGGPHHQLSVKYLPAYIDERRWRSGEPGQPARLPRHDPGPPRGRGNLL